MQATLVTRSGKSYRITYTFDLGNGKRRQRRVVVNSTHRPTRSAAERFAHDDLCSNAFLGHSRGQYGFKNIRIKWIDLYAHTILDKTKQAPGVDPAVAHITNTRGEAAAFD